MTEIFLDTTQWLMLIVFVIGFGLIAFGSKYIDNILASFLTALFCWGLIAWKHFISGTHFDTDQFYHALGDTSNIVFFLIFALIIVEVVKVYQGFDQLTHILKRFSTHKNGKLYFNQLLWAVTLVSFFLAAVIDNVTAALILTVIIGKIVKDRKDLYFLAMFGGIIGANAGGTWSPLGEITTTQLWASGQITFLNTVFTLFIPSLISVLVPLFLYSKLVKNRPLDIYASEDHPSINIMPKHTQIITLTAIASILTVIPFLKGGLGLPPAIGAMAALCILWIVAELLERKAKRFNESIEQDQKQYEVINLKGTLIHIEWETPLFFLGILLAVAALKEQNILQQFGLQIDSSLSQYSFQQPLVTFIVGAISAIMDNVALVATVQGMYPKTLAGYEMDSIFWFLLSFCAGTGGSMLVVGSAAGVAVRNKLEDKFEGRNLNLDRWYQVHITKWAVINYVTGFLVCLLQYWIIRVTVNNLCI